MNKKDEKLLHNYLWLILMGLYETEQILDLMPEIIDMDYKRSLKDAE